MSHMMPARMTCVNDENENTMKPLEKKDQKSMVIVRNLENGHWKSNMLDGWRRCRPSWRPIVEKLLTRLDGGIKDAGVVDHHFVPRDIITFTLPRVSSEAATWDPWTADLRFRGLLAQCGAFNTKARFWLSQGDWFAQNHPYRTPICPLVFTKPFTCRQCNQAPACVCKWYTFTDTYLNYRASITIDHPLVACFLLYTRALN